MASIDLSKMGEDFKSRIIEKQKIRGIIASGRSAQSLRVESDDVMVRVYGAQTFIWQEFGRGPSKNPKAIFPLRRGIRQWIDDKPVQPVNVSKDSLAFFISRKIHLYGTRLWRKLNKGEANNAQPVGIAESIAEVVKAFRPQLQKQLLVSFKSDILKNLKVNL